MSRNRTLRQIHERDTVAARQVVKLRLRGARGLSKSRVTTDECADEVLAAAGTVNVAPGSNVVAVRAMGPSGKVTGAPLLLPSVPPGSRGASAFPPSRETVNASTPRLIAAVPYEIPLGATTPSVFIGSGLYGGEPGEVLDAIAAVLDDGATPDPLVTVDPESLEWAPEEVPEDTPHLEAVRADVTVDAAAVPEQLVGYLVTRGEVTP